MSPESPWTMTTAQSEAQLVRWGQLKRNFNVPQVMLDREQDATRQRAQQIYEERRARGVEGTELGDWLQAEREIRGK